MSLFDALLEVPVSLLEAAVVQAQQRAPKPPLHERLRQGEIGALVRLLPNVAVRGYGWRQVVALRSAVRAEICIDGTGPCGHEFHAKFDERAASMPPSMAGDAIRFAILYAGQVRSCFCVQRQEVD